MSKADQSPAKAKRTAAAIPPALIFGAIIAMATALALRLRESVPSLRESVGAFFGYVLIGDLVRSVLISLPIWAVVWFGFIRPTGRDLAMRSYYILVGSAFVVSVGCALVKGLR